MSPNAGTGSPNSVSFLKASGPELEATSSPEALDTSSVHGVMSLTML